MKKMPKITLHDLACKTGYSVSQISRALNAKGRFSAETREKIVSAARDLGYVNYHGENRKRVVVVQGADYYLNTFRNHIDSFLIQHRVDSLGLNLNAVEVLVQLLCDLIILIDAPEQTAEKLRKQNLHNLLQVRLFTGGAADLKADTTKFIDRARQYFAENHCRNTLLLVPDFAPCKVCDLPDDMRNLTVEQVKLGQWQNFAGSDQVKKFDSIIFCLPEHPMKFLNFALRCRPDIFIACDSFSTDTDPAAVGKRVYMSNTLSTNLAEDLQKTLQQQSKNMYKY